MIPDATVRYIKSFLLCSDSEEDLALFDTIDGHSEMVETAFRLLSRYDEYQSEAPLDIHSRFLPENSFLGRNGMLRCPLLDEYTTQIYKQLGRPKPHRESHIYLTHDIDSVVRYRRLRGFIGGLYRSLRGVKGYNLRDVFASLHDVNRDPDYTFALLQQIDSQLPEAEVIYFVKPDYSHYAHFDRPMYSHTPSDFRALTHLTMGLHSLYYTFDHPSTLRDQCHSVQRLPKVCSYHRAHYLRLLRPEQMHLYSDAGITDDFSMAYASAPGFRLGTTRPVRCIDPSDGTLLPLTLHPLTIMDTSFSDPRYLNLPYDEAYALATSLIDTTLRYEGDVTLLFHNGTFLASYHQRLYRALIEYLKNHK